VRVIAPAHRDDDTAVIARLRSARQARWPSGPSTPQRILPASSLRYTDPKNKPIVLNVVASAAVTFNRVRTRTPAGGAATTGSTIRRNALVATATSWQRLPTNHLRAALNILAVALTSAHMRGG
jgi:hypothetical protein